MKNTMIIDETINWNKVQNNMTQTQAEAPYLGAVQPKGTVTFAALVAGVREDGCSESELEITRVMTKQAELLKSYVAQNYKVYFPFGIAGVHLTKSFPSQDAPFDPTVNEAIMSILTNAETRKCLDGVTLKEDTSAAATLRGPKINSVCTGGNRFGVIVCHQPFTVAGSGLRLDPSKTTDRLTLTSDKTGAVTDVTGYTCDGEGFRVDAQVNASLTPGKYTLTAYVDMGDAEHPNVLKATHKVTVEAGEAPVPPDPTYPIISEDGKFKLDQPTAERPSANALNCTFEIVEGLGELYPAVGLAGTKLSKSLVSAEGGVACTYCNIDETFPSRLHVRFGAHDAQVGDKRYVHLTYAEGKTVVLPVTVTEEA